MNRFDEGNPPPRNMEIANLQENVALAPLTTLNVGGMARHFLRAITPTDVVRAVHYANRHAMPLFTLGGGSNLLVSDAGFSGLVLKIDLMGSAWEQRGTETMVTVGAGEEWNRFVDQTIARGLAGVECLTGIPGNVGGAPVQNIGAYGQEVQETIASVQTCDLQTGELRTFQNEECGFAYRTSLFNTTSIGRYVILSVTFRLRENGEPTLKYHEVIQTLKERDIAPTLQTVREVVRALRTRKGMLISDDEPNRRSAGSFFKNVIVTKAQFSEIERKAWELGVLPSDRNAPQFPYTNEEVKIPAAWLIEMSGFKKGEQQGQAAISSKHVLALVNLGGATAQEIVDLAKRIQDRVEEHFDVHLKPEPVFLGFDAP